MVHLFLREVVLKSFRDDKHQDPSYINASLSTLVDA